LRLCRTQLTCRQYRRVQCHPVELAVSNATHKAQIA
jgi:hypothetical protein